MLLLFVMLNSRLNRTFALGSFLTLRIFLKISFYGSRLLIRAGINLIVFFLKKSKSYLEVPGFRVHVFEVLRSLPAGN